MGQTNGLTAVSSFA